MPQKTRYALVDGLRGLAIVNMLAFHFLYDVFVIYGRDPSWYARRPVYLWQQGICWSFILLSGFCWRWGKKHALRRGLFLNLCGLLVTLVTVLAVPSEAIWFGILNFLGCAVLLTLPLDRLLEKIPSWAGLGGSFLLFLLCRSVPQGALRFAGHTLLSLPRALYGSRLLVPLGFPYPGFSSSDYFPLLPWLFLFWTGYFFFPVFQRREAWKAAARRPLPLLSVLGRYSVWIYLAHQPLAMLLCQLLFG